MTGYASGTSVSADRSIDQIKSYLRKRGADKIMTMEEGDSAALMFMMEGRVIRFWIQMPEIHDFLITDAGRERKLDVARKLVDDEWKRRWRVLAIVLKGKFELVDSGIVELEEEFLSHIVTEDGRTIYQHMKPALDGGSQQLVGTMPSIKELGTGR
jgi:hypothetical protein